MPLYLGHFSFDEVSEEPRFGYFTCMVEAKNANATEAAFRKLITGMRKAGQLFIGPVDIFLDALVEVGEVPKAGVVTCYSSYSEDGLGRLSTYLPHNDAGGCHSFYYYPESKPEIPDSIRKMETYAAEPFLSFDVSRDGKSKREPTRPSEPPTPPSTPNRFRKKSWGG
ncbi:hypothetical protein A2G06_02360 [Geobacter anodireducens]|nr:hypothetical protein A2G06_02360 [Geobacter anodireducens]